MTINASAIASFNFREEILDSRTVVEFIGREFCHTRFSQQRFSKLCAARYARAPRAGLAKDAFIPTGKGFAAETARGARAYPDPTPESFRRHLKRCAKLPADF